MNTHEHEQVRFHFVADTPAVSVPEAVGGVPVDEADLPIEELSDTYVPDDLQEPV
ncbi:hypothetical protein [Ralstonia chuxiongensis]|uniref:hypothetical protein n=1 Tax=Ralstonia chuxiongensis TaxID=2957504 RepID=UPI0028F5975E|nr:hypothetical protein [Ralstonia chuxiongensis]CAJ0781485.1 hypothetical protein R8510_04880 [Ralstonia chuxiongensis]